MLFPTSPLPSLVPGSTGSSRVPLTLTLGFACFPPQSHLLLPRSARAKSGFPVIFGHTTVGCRRVFAWFLLGLAETDDARGRSFSWRVLLSRTAFTRTVPSLCALLRIPIWWVFFLHLGSFRLIVHDRRGKTRKEKERGTGPISVCSQRFSLVSLGKKRISSGKPLRYATTSRGARGLRSVCGCCPVAETPCHHLVDGRCHLVLTVWAPPSALGQRADECSSPVVASPATLDVIREPTQAICIRDRVHVYKWVRLVCMSGWHMRKAVRRHHFRRNVEWRRCGPRLLFLSHTHTERCLGRKNSAASEMWTRAPVMPVQNYYSLRRTPRHHDASARPTCIRARVQLPIPVIRSSGSSVAPVTKSTVGVRTGFDTTVR